MKLFSSCTGIRASIVRCLLITVVLSLTIVTPGFAQTFSWQQTNGPEGGSTYSILAQSSDQLFATFYGWGGTVYRSSDNGNSWNLSNTGVENSGYLGALAADASGRIFMGSVSGVFRSTDNGANWSYRLGLSNAYVVAVNTSGYIFVGNGFNEQQDGVYRSTDNGDTFLPTNIGLTNTSVSSFAFKQGGYVFAGTHGGGVFRSTDNGDSWTEVNIGLGNLGLLSLLATSSGDLFAGTADGLYRSTNNGDSWSTVGLGISLSQNYFVALAENLVGDIFVGEQINGIFRSTDGGNTWVQVNSGLSSLWVTCFQVNSLGHIFAGTTAGVYRSTNNGNSWTWINTGIKATVCQSFATLSSGVTYTAALGGGVFRSTDNGGNWSKTSLGNISVISAVAADPVGNVYAADFYPYSGITMFRSSDGGSSWVPLPSPVAFFVNVLATNSSGHVFAGNDNSAYRSTDGGATWTQIINGLTNTNIRAFLIRPAGEMFVGTADGVFRSTNNGDSWSPSSNGLLFKDVTCLIRNVFGNMFAGTQSGGLFRSIDNGSTWSACNSGFPYPSTLAFATNSIGHIFVSSSYYLYRSTNNGNSWESIGMSGGFVGPAPSLAITMDGSLLVGSYGVGVYRSAESTVPGCGPNRVYVCHKGKTICIEITSLQDHLKHGDTLGPCPLDKEGDEVAEIPTQYGLGQNYPNPFNPSTTITYQIPEKSFVSLKVFDVLGSEVETLVNGEKQPGTYEVKFNASHLSSGIYFYKLITGSFVEIKKMIVMK